MRIFCVPCCRWYTIKDLREGVKTVTDRREDTRRGDLHTCNGCGHQIVADFGEPYFYPLEADYRIQG